MAKIQRPKVQGAGSMVLASAIRRAGSMVLASAFMPDPEGNLQPLGGQRQTLGRAGQDKLRKRRKAKRQQKTQAQKKNRR